MEEYLSLTQAAAIAPGRPHATAVWRWARKGIKARNGERIRLQHIRSGARIFTKLEWLEDFFEALREADSEYFERTSQDRSDSPVPTRTELQRAKDVEIAEKKLERAGA